MITPPPPPLRTVLFLALLSVPLTARAGECPASTEPSDLDAGTSLIFAADDTTAESTLCQGGGSFHIQAYTGDTLLGVHNEDPNGTTTQLGAYLEGDELIVWIYVPETGKTWYSGPAWRNADNKFHAAVSQIGPQRFVVGFTDREGGGGDQYAPTATHLYSDISLVIDADLRLERLPDTDGDSVPNDQDVCLYEDDLIDLDGSGYPDCAERGEAITLTGSVVTSDCGVPAGTPATWTLDATQTLTTGNHTSTFSAGSFGASIASPYESYAGFVSATSAFDSLYAYAVGAEGSVEATVYADLLDDAGRLVASPPKPVYAGYTSYAWVSTESCSTLVSFSTVEVRSWDDDGDGVPNELDLCLGDDLTDDTDADGVCGDRDGCEGDDSLGDTDDDGTCDDLDTCPADPTKAGPGDCGCGAPDDDSDADGITDCLEEDLFLSARRSTLSFDTRRPNQSYAQFTGSLELGGGLLAPDLRDGANGVAHATVTVGSTSPISLYDADLSFTVTDGRVGTDNQEGWKYKQSSVEEVSIQWENSQTYASGRDADLPSVRASSNLGELRSRFVHSDETRLRFRWNSGTTLPLTIAVDGVPVLTVRTGACVDSATTMCVDGYGVDSTYDLFEVHADHHTHVVDVAYTGDRLGDGNLIAWYQDADATDGLQTLLYSHEAIDDGSATSVWFNAGGRYDLTVPLAGTGVSASSTDRVATVTLQVGDADTRAAAEGQVSFSGYAVSSGRTNTVWRTRELAEDDDHGSCEDED